VVLLELKTFVSGARRSGVQEPGFLSQKVMPEVSAFLLAALICDQLMGRRGPIRRLSFHDNVDGI